jgi:hypothetical protein
MKELSMNSTTARTIGRRLAFGLSFVTVAGAAAVTSYAHMRDVAILGHQPPALAAVLPLSVDGLLVIASLAMAEDKAQNRHPRTWARVAFWFGAVISLAANIASTAVHHGGDPLSIGVSAWPPLALLVVTLIMARPGKAKAELATGSQLTPAAAAQLVDEPVAVPMAAPVQPMPVPQAPAAVVQAAPVSPAPMTPVIAESPEVLAFREAQKALRTTSRISALNGAAKTA